MIFRLEKKDFSEEYHSLFEFSAPLTPILSLRYAFSRGVVKILSVAAKILYDDN
jgi:hypothetical protein